MMWLWSEGYPGWWTWRWAVRRMRVDRHVVGENGVACVCDTRWKGRLWILLSLKEDIKHLTIWDFVQSQVLLTLGVLTVGHCRGHLSLAGLSAECYLKQSFGTFPRGYDWKLSLSHKFQISAFPIRSGFSPFFSHSICVIHEQSASTLSDICETHFWKKWRRWKVSWKCVNDLAPS